MTVIDLLSPACCLTRTVNQGLQAVIGFLLSRFKMSVGAPAHSETFHRFPFIIYSADIFLLMHKTLLVSYHIHQSHSEDLSNVSMQRRSWAFIIIVLLCFCCGKTFSENSVSFASCSFQLFSYPLKIIIIKKITRTDDVTTFFLLLAVHIFRGSAVAGGATSR